MKKTIKFLVTGLLCFSFLSIHAQLTPGFKAGLNSANLSGFAGDRRVSAHAGFFLHYRINKNWCIQPELLYSGEGQRYFADGEERRLALDYIQAPMMIQYFPIQRFYVEFGPQAGLLVSARDRGSRGDNINVRSDYTGAQVGLNVGTGLYITPNFGFYGRYNFGLTDVSRFDDIVDQSNVGQVGMIVRLRSW